tara:strand:- start:5038 stop:5622 length:585 start_codon:yes stop_codon:yes gene_type:complete
MKRRDILTNILTFILCLEYVTVFQMESDDPFVELTFKVPRYRRHCAKWFDDKSPDTIADALALSCSAYATFQRVKTPVNSWDHNDELRELDCYYQKMISEISEVPKTVVEEAVVENVQPLFLKVRHANKSKSKEPTEEQIEKVINAIHCYYDVKKRYPQTIKPLRSHMSESDWNSLQDFKGQYKEILQLVCPNS